MANIFWKICALVWILVECSLAAGNIFGFASLFSVLPKYKIYQSECSNDSKCTEQIDKYQLAFALGIGFYNLPAVIIGIINDYFGPRSLKLFAIIFHIISWLSLAYASPGHDWLIFFHTIFISLSGICTLLSSMSISAHFTQHRGLVTSLISGAQLTGSVWYAIFQIVIEKGWLSLSTLCFLWTSASILMLGSAFLFLDWRFTCVDSRLKVPIQKSEDEHEHVKTIASKDSLIRHLKNPLFIVVSLFLSLLLLTISYLPVVWFKWIMHLTNKDEKKTNFYTFLYNFVGVFGIVVAPLSGFIVDYKAFRGYTQKMLNISILQTITWIFAVVLCIVCMFQSIYAAIAALIILLFARPILVAGSQALIVTAFPPQYIGSLLGIMWTLAGIISFTTSGLVQLAKQPTNIWRGWVVILSLCILMSGHLIQVWRLYIRSKQSNRKTPETAIHAEELKNLNEL